MVGGTGAREQTRVRMIMGVVAPDDGGVVFARSDITKMRMFKRSRLGIGYLSQEPSIFQRLTVRQNLLAILETMAINRAERHRRANMLIERFSLEEVANSHGRFLSGGERRKLEISRAMITNPSLILLE